MTDGMNRRRNNGDLHVSTLLQWLVPKLILWLLQVPG